MFKEERDELKFTWNMIGDVVEGRPNLGTTMDVSVYRLMQFTLRDVLIKEFDVKTADKASVVCQGGVWRCCAALFCCCGTAVLECTAFR